MLPMGTSRHIIIRTLSDIRGWRSIKEKTMLTSERIEADLTKAIAAENADDFEESVRSVFSFGDTIGSEISALLANALPMTWHTRHEDIVNALQDAKDPNTVDALYAAALATHEYLEFDENFGLARKCTWALADIGTEAARARLEELARCSNPKIRSYARKRLDNWQEEIQRKKRY